MRKAPFMFEWQVRGQPWLIFVHSVSDSEVQFQPYWRNARLPNDLSPARVSLETFRRFFSSALGA